MKRKKSKIFNNFMLKSAIITLSTAMFFADSCKPDMEMEEEEKKEETETEQTTEQKDLIQQTADSNLTDFLNGKLQCWFNIDLGESSLKVFKNFINNPKVDLNCKNDGYYPLESVIYYSPASELRDERVKLLLAKPEFDLKKQSAEVMNAAINRIYNTAFYLMFNDPRLDINAIEKKPGFLFDDCTMLMCASASGASNYAAALLSHPGIDINKTNSKNQTSLMKAVDSDNIEIAEMHLKRKDLNLYITDFMGKMAFDKCKSPKMRKLLLGRIKSDAKNGSIQAQYILDKINNKIKTLKLLRKTKESQLKNFDSIYIKEK